jgi:metallo-beta-lactamase family protein
MNNGTIPRIPVWIDSPMASNATGVFNIHPECFNENLKKEFISKGRNPFSVRTLKFVNNFKESLRVAKSSKPCIIISCNGMCQNGRIVNHLYYNIENPNNTVLIVGYMSENTLGRKILDKCEKVVINNKELELKCEVQRISAFSAHADYQEIIDWLKQIDTSKLKKIFLVHGDEASLKNLKHLLTNEGYKAEIVEEGQKYKLN